MRRFFLSNGLLIVLLCATLTGLGQFGITPTDSLVDVFPTDSLTRVYQIDFPNQTEDSLGLSWRWIDGGWTEGWDVNLCDLGECYTGIPGAADMLACPTDGAGYLKLLVNALDIEGACVLHFWVWPTGNQDALVNVYFDLRNGGVNSVAFSAPESEFSVHPNPIRAGRMLHFRGAGNPNFSSNCVQRFSPKGELFPCHLKLAPFGWTLSTQNWRPGIHLLSLGDGRTAQRIVVH
jgi:hypothetical protein